jgi:type I restriction enzyme, S subunit
MKKGWEELKIGDVCTILDSKRKPITKKNRIEGEIPYYGATGVLIYVKDFLFDEKLVLLGEDGAKWESGDRSAFIITGKTWVNNHAHVLKPHRELILDEWLTYNLNHQNLMPYISGMTVPKLNQGNMRKIPIPIPPLSEQEEIVEVLDTAFAAIDQAKANIEQNIANAKELFQSKLNQIFSQKGEGWVETAFTETADLIDSLHKTPKYVDDGYAMVRVTDIKSRTLDLSKTKRVDEQTYKEFSKRHKPRVGDIIFSRVGSYGKSTLIDCLDEPFCLGQNTVYMLPKCNAEFLYFFLNSPACMDQLDKLKSGTTQPTVSLKSIKSMHLPIPSEDIQTTTVSYMNSLMLSTDDIIVGYQTKLASLDELKKSILQKAFAGELT